MSSLDGVNIEEIEEKRIERGIPSSTFGELVGFAYGKGWRTAVQKNSLSREKAKVAKFVIEYYDQHGIVPEPGFVEVADVGPEGE